MLKPKTQARVWFVSELYYPELTSTGYYVTGIAEGLARSYSVAVLCGQPTYAARGARAPKHETRRGVEIWRCSATTFNKDKLLLRVINLATISLAVLGSALRRVRAGDVVVVTTNPPTLPFVVMAVCRIRGARQVLIVHDVYPDVLVASGLAESSSFLVRILRGLQRRLYRSVDRIVVLGRDAATLITRQAGVTDGRLVRIPNWADLVDVRPSSKSGNSLLMQLGITDQFVVQYSGNMGRTHALEGIVDAAERLRSRSSVRFVFIGSGARQKWLIEAVASRGLSNVSVLPHQPRNGLNVSLNACDVAIVSFAPGMLGVSVPSRMYNILAAGKPIIAVVDEESELAHVVREEGVGWVVPPGSNEALDAVILQAEVTIEAREQMGIRARSAAERRYAYELVIDAYREALSRFITPSRG